MGVPVQLFYETFTSTVIPNEVHFTVLLKNQTTYVH